MAEHKPYKKFVKAQSPYLGEWDLPENEDIILTIKDVQAGEVTGDKGKVDQGMVIYFEEKDYKPLFCNITNAKTIERIYGTRFMDEWVGKKVQLYVDPNIAFGRKITRGIRIRDKKPESKDPVYSCSVCGAVITKELYQQTVKAYGKAYCSKECKELDQNGKNIL